MNALTIGKRLLRLALALGIVTVGFYGVAYTAAYAVNWWNNRHLAQIEVINDPKNAECLEQNPFGVVVGYTNKSDHTFNRVTIRYFATGDGTSRPEADVLQDGTLNFDFPVEAGETRKICYSLRPREGAPTSGLTLYAQILRAE